MKRGLAIAALFAVCLAQAQEQPPAQPGLPPIPPITEGKRIERAALVPALQKGGFVFYLRHAETGPTSEDCAQSNLTAKGREQAKVIGEAIRALKIPIGQVISSDVCRALETAQLANVGAVVTHDDLHRIPKRPDHKFHEGRAKLIATPPQPATNTLLVGHIHFGNGADQRLFMEIGEIIVFRPQGEGSPDVVARIRFEDWAKLEGK